MRSRLRPDRGGPRDAANDRRARATAVPLLVASFLLVAGFAGCECDQGVQGLTARVEAAPESLDFAASPVGVTTPLKLTLVSAGTGSVTLKSIRVEGAGADAFVAPLLPERPELASGVRLDVDVGFHPGAVGTYDAELVVESNDLDSPLRVPLTGEGKAPDVAVCDVPASESDPLECAPPGACLQVDFGRVLDNQSAFAEALVRNEGEAKLVILQQTLSDGAEAAGFSVGSDLSGTGIVAGGGQRLGFHFFGRQQGPQTARLTLATNDPDEPEACIDLKADGAPNTPPLACAAVQEIRHHDKSTEVPADGTRPLARPLDRLFLTAHPSADCSIDGEDGLNGLRYAWTLVSRPDTSGATLVNATRGGTVSPDPPAATSPYLDIDAVGEYVVDLTVTDKDGLVSTPAEIVVDAVPRDDITVELTWNQPADLDVHLIAPGGEPFCGTLDCFEDTCDLVNGVPVLDWGPDTTGDGKPDPDGLAANNPGLMIDNIGSTIVSGTADERMENIRLARAPELSGGLYRVAVYYFPKADGSIPPEDIAASVKVVHRGRILFEDTHTFAKDARGEFWTAGEVDISAGTGQVLDAVSSYPTYFEPGVCQ